MFRKTLAAATTALVAAIFTFGAVAAPAMADGSVPAAPTSTVSTDSGAAGTDSTPAPDPSTPADSTPPASTPPADGTPAPDETTPPVTQTPDAQPSTPPVVTQTFVSSARTTSTTPPVLRCLPARAVSYTYDRVSNSGQITITQLDSTKFTDQLCKGFYVTAAGWRFLNLEGESYMWPQGLIGYNQANGGDVIEGVGTYDFGFPVTCGQGDIYASYDKNKVAPPPDILLSPSNPYPEYFLQDLFRNHGPYPTSMWTGPNDHTGQYCQVIDDQKVAPSVTVIDQCNTGGKITWTDRPGEVTYALTKGDGISGENEVTATAGAGWVFPDNTTTHVYSIDLGTLTDCGVTPGDPTVTPAVCTDGTQGNGTIFVDQKPGILNYTVTYPDGHTATVTAAAISVTSGTYVVNVTAAPGYQIAGATEWPLDVTVGPATNCQLPTDADLPTSVTSTGATCSSGTGSITVGPTSDYLEFIDYFIDGTKVTQPTTAVKPGTHLVTASLNPTTAAGDTLDDPGPWTITIDAASVACGQLKTLALTGTNPATPLLAAGILLPAGAALLLGAALIRRRREQ